MTLKLQITEIRSLCLLLSLICGWLVQAVTLPWERPNGWNTTDVFTACRQLLAKLRFLLLWQTAFSRLHFQCSDWVSLASFVTLVSCSGANLEPIKFSLSLFNKFTLISDEQMLTFSLFYHNNHFLAWKKCSHDVGFQMYQHRDIARVMETIFSCLHVMWHGIRGHVTSSL